MKKLVRTVLLVFVVGVVLVAGVQSGGAGGVIGWAAMVWVLARAFPGLRSDVRAAATFVRLWRQGRRYAHHNMTV